MSAWRAEVFALREMGERAAAACERQERLLEALLTLSRSVCDVYGGSASTSRLPPKSRGPTRNTNSGPDGA